MDRQACVSVLYRHQHVLDRIVNLISGTLDSFVPVALIIWFFSIRKIWNDNFDLPKQFNQVYSNDMNMYIYKYIYNHKED